MCFLLCVICAFLLASFKLGIVGSFFFNLVAYFFGVLTYPVLIGGVAYSVWIIYNNDKKKIPKRYYAGTASSGSRSCFFKDAANSRRMRRGTGPRRSL